MNQRSDIDRLLRHWMDDGPSTMPDRIVDVVADRISLQRQRRSWRLLRRLPMNTFLKLGAAAAAVLIVAVVAWQVLPPTGGVGGQATPSPTGAPSAAPTQVPALPDGTFAPGTYRLSPLASAPNLRIHATVPAGWAGFGSWAIIGPRDSHEPDGIAIAFIAADGIYSDPCHWDLAGDHSWPQPGDVQVGATVDDLVNALVANDAYVSTTPTNVTLGGYNGKRLDLQLPTDIASCDKDFDAEERYFVFSGPDGGLHAQGPDWRMHLWIVDAGGTRLIASLGDFAGTPEPDRVAAQAILDSLVIKP